MPSFTALSTTGGPVDSDFLPLPAVIAFFDVGCEPCREEAPRFARQAVARPELNALAVVVGEAGPMSAVLEESCLVVVEPAGGSVAEAFGVRGFPAMCLLDERGVIAATGSDLTVLTSAPVRPGARR
ncbi:hypothetical protein FHS22_003901 [Planomonospora venezuelensis]|uniref:Thioredoxin domain-containing protein n=2 Tax=Planomonospora venezuelensis TaxID=1999 RepID=A0A841D7V9_PLAVE|nr:hypothetical protein [Planomonospora venezuelensis]